MATLQHLYIYIYIYIGTKTINVILSKVLTLDIFLSFSVTALSLIKN